MKLTAIWGIEASFRNIYPTSSSKCFGGMKFLIKSSSILYKQKRPLCLRIGKWSTWSVFCLAVWFFNVVGLPFCPSWSPFSFTYGVLAKWPSWMIPHSNESRWSWRGSSEERRPQHILTSYARTIINFPQLTTFLLLLPSKTGNLPSRFAIKHFSRNFGSNVAALGVLP